MDASLRSAGQIGHSKRPFPVIPSESEESSMDASLRLRFVQHDGRCHSERERGIHVVWMLRFAQHDSVESMDASLRSAGQERKGRSKLAHHI